MRRRWNKKKANCTRVSEAIGKASLDSHCVLVADIDEHLQAIPPHPNMPIASYLMVPVVCTLGHYGLGIDFNRGCHWINGSLLPPGGALAMKPCPLGGGVSPAFIIQPANTPQGASCIGIAFFIACGKSHCYSSEMWRFGRYLCREGELKEVSLRRKLCS